MPWTISWHRTVACDLAELDRPVQGRILKKVQALLEHPNPSQAGKPLRHQLSAFRALRVGDHRVIFHPEEETQTIFILVIGPRDNDIVYRAAEHRRGALELLEDADQRLAQVQALLRHQRGGSSDAPPEAAETAPSAPSHE